MHSLKVGQSGSFYSPPYPALPPLVTAEKGHFERTGDGPLTEE